MLIGTLPREGSHGTREGPRIGPRPGREISAQEGEGHHPEHRARRERIRVPKTRLAKKQGSDRVEPALLGRPARLARADGTKNVLLERGRRLFHLDPAQSREDPAELSV